MRVLLWGLVFAFAMSGAFAQTDQGDARTPEEIEVLALEVSQSLRCVVCQGQSIEDSNAPLAADMRRIVRERLAAGDTPAEVREFMTERYGNFVLMRPPLQFNTLILWFGPLLALIGALAAALIYLRSGTEAPRAAPSDLAAEEATLDAALAQREDRTR